MHEKPETNPKEVVTQNEPPKKEYESPQIIYRAPLEAMAAACDIKPTNQS